MSKQHFIPAAYIGNFSFEELGKNRRRMVWVKKRGLVSPYEKRAEKVAYKINLYSDFVDKQWGSVEKNLMKAISELIDSNKTQFSADMWVVLVQFIAQLFVRGYEFDLRFKDRIHGGFNGDGLDEHIDINMSRLIELQRLYAPIMYSDWTVLHNKTDKPIITNDLGFGLMADTTKRKFGYAFPLSKSAVLILTMGDRTSKRIAPVEFCNNMWSVISITHGEIDGNNINGLNRSLSEFCLNEIYGSTKESVNYCLLEERPIKFGTDPYFLIPDNKDYLRDCEMDFFKLITIMNEAS